MIRFSLPCFLWLLVGIAVGCDAPGAPDATPVVAVKSAKDVVRDDLPTWLEFAAREQVETASLKRELSRPLAELEALGLRHVNVLHPLYQTRKHRPVWVDLAGQSARGLNASGIQLREALAEGASKHGLFEEDLHLADIAALEGANVTERAFEKVRFDAAELLQVEAWERANPLATVEEHARALAQPDGPTPRLAALVARRIEELRAQTSSKVRLDLYLSDALVEYGTRMRWGNDAWYRGFDYPDHLDEPVSDTRLARVDLRRARRDLHARRELLPVFEAPAKLPETLQQLIPPFEQYQRLSEAFRQYSAMVEAGGWETLPEGTGELAVGDSAAEVTALKRRLRAEGYWQGDESPDFTESLAAALREYQRTHQLWEKGSLSRETRASLSVPAERRLAQIRVALQRWRESSIGDDRHYIFVNIPDFHAEAWEDGARKLRIATVVGATTHERDPQTGAFEYVHATPSLSSAIEHVVLNPYWWVPGDIAAKEIEPEVAKNPWYLQENGYEYAEDDRGQAVLRQKPGPNNALGRVKINFDNPFQIYMHDTPEKPLFKWPARAFSHGCIRLQKPMQLARYLLERDGSWDEERISSLLDSGAEKWLTLQQPVPVHIEYYVVRVDDRGRANFLSDLYARDVSRMSAAMRPQRADQTAPVNTVK